MLFALMLPAHQAARDGGRRASKMEGSAEFSTDVPLVEPSCGAAKNDPSMPPPPAAEYPAEPSTGSADNSRFMAAGFLTNASSAPVDATPTTESIAHKIVYSATLQLAVEGFDNVPDQVAALVRKSVAPTSPTRNSRAIRAARGKEPGRCACRSPASMNFWPALKSWAK